MRLPEVGSVFQSKYRLDSILGAGGFATVFKATDLGAERAVALKILTPELRGYSHTVRSRFEREVRVVAGLRDPHTIKLFDFGTSPDGLLFMVTEYVHGEDLSDLIAHRSRLEPAEVVHIMRQVLSSLREAHTAGLLHRDIKPANIRIYDYMGDPLRVKVLDFGIAKPLQSDSPGLTADGEVVGTLKYMSPEQLLASDLAPSSDIYSLGVVAFEMLLGRSGVHGSRLSDQMERLVSGHVFSVPELQRIGTDLGRVLDRMAARDRNERFQTADEVLAALHHATRAAPTAPPAGSRPSDALIPPPAPDTNPPWLAHGAAPSTGSVEIPRPLPRTEPGHTAAVIGPPNRRLVVIAAVVVSLVVALGAILIATLVEPDRPVPPPVVTRRANPFVASAPTPPPEPAVVDAPDSDADGPPTASSGCGDLPPFEGYGDLHGRLSAYIPRRYDPQRAYPLVVMFHENMEQPDAFLRYSRMTTLASERGFVIIAPYGGGDSPLGDAGTAWTSDDVIARTRRAVTMTSAALCIDQERIFAIGHAAGGKLVERIPCELPMFRAIATTSYRSEPTDRAKLCVPEKPLPYLILQPDQDGYNPIKGGKSCSGVMKISLTQKERLWRERQKCGGKRSVWLSEGRHECVQWECEAAFISCHLHGGRNWPGLESRLWDKFSGNCDGTPADFDYGGTIWSFFQQQSTD